ncbi:MAG: hypothetical protein CL840_06575 [Crocinitomicaceae bacterium]|nr:hypothetical protein [Crocinitomicaceae bacterium]|tara:strand:+ start:3403 stop:6288 length:2886 start_codon:yes stop_codon:yes gene_type:complete
MVLVPFKSAHAFQLISEYDKNVTLNGTRIENLNQLVSFPNSGIVSKNILKADQMGDIQFTTPVEEQNIKVVGFTTSQSSTLTLASIEFAFYIDDQNAYVYESGTLIGSMGTHLAANAYKIVRTDAGDIEYYIDGLIVHTSTTTNSSDLFAKLIFEDASLAEQSSIIELQLSFLPSYDLTIDQTSSSTYTITGSTNRNTDNTASQTWGESGAIFKNLVDTGDSGVVVFNAVSASNQSVAFGLVSSGYDYHYNTIHYGFFVDGNGNLDVMEDGTSQYVYGSFNNSDLIKIRINDASIVEYYVNEALIYTSLSPITAKHYVGTAFYDSPTEVSNMYTSFVPEVGYMAHTGSYYLGGTSSDYQSLGEIETSLEDKEITTNVIYYVGEGIYTGNAELSSPSLKATAGNISFIGKGSELSVLSSSDEVLSIEDVQVVNLINLKLQTSLTDGICASFKNLEKLNIINCEISNAGNGTSLQLEHIEEVNIMQCRFTGSEFGLLTSYIDEIRINNSEFAVDEQAISSLHAKSVHLIGNAFDNTSATSDCLHFDGVKDGCYIDANEISGESDASIGLTKYAGTIKILNNHIEDKGQGINFRNVLAENDEVPIMDIVIVSNYVKTDNSSLIFSESSSSYGDYAGSAKCQIGKNTFKSVNEDGLKAADLPFKILQVLNNEIVSKKIGIEVLRIPEIDQQITPVISIGGNLVASELEALELGELDGKVQIFSNTLVSKTPDYCSKIENCDDVELSLNVVVNENETSTAKVIYYNQIPNSYSSSNNDYYPFSQNTDISNLSNNMVLGNDQTVDPRFMGNEYEVDVDDLKYYYSLAYCSALLNVTPKQRSNLTYDDLNGKLRPECLDMGAIEIPNGPYDGLQIKFELNHDFSFTPDAQSGPSSFKITGLNAYTTVKTEVFKTDAFGADIKIFESTSPTTYWTGIDDNTGSLVAPGSYKFTITLDNEKIGGYVFVQK